MIRIETTAEFDAEGRFTVTGQTTEPVAPGAHRVTVEVDDATYRLTEGNSATEAEESAFQKIGNVWVFTGEVLEDPDQVRRRLDEEFVDRMLHGSCE